MTVKPTAAPSPQSGPHPLATLAGGLLLAAGMLLGLGYVVAAAVATLDVATLLGSTALTALVIGVALVAPALRPDRPPAVFGRQSPLVWLGAYVGVLGLGFLLLRAGGAARWLFPPLHGLAALLPALAIIGVVAWHRDGWTWSGALGGLAYGSCVAAFGALLLEGVVLVVAGALLLAVLEVGGGADALLETLERALAAANRTGELDMAALEGVLASPAVLLTAFAVMGVVAPLIEEALKLGLVVLRRPGSRAEAWMWGVAAGAGFGLVEAVTIGSAMLDGWAVIMLVRALAMLMHATMTGLAALGWYVLVVERQPRGWLGLVGAAVGHMVWNSLVLLAALGGLMTALGDGPWGQVALGATALLIVLFYAITLGFRTITRRVTRQDAAAA